MQMVLKSITWRKQARDGDDDIEERFKKADRIYIYQVMKGKPDVFTELMDSEWEEVSHDKNIGLYVFERKN